MLPYIHMQRQNMKESFQKEQQLYIKRNKDDLKKMILVNYWGITLFNLPMILLKIF